MNSEKSAIDFKRVLEEFLEFREWGCEILFSEDTQEWRIDTGIDLSEQNGRLIIEGHDQSGLVGIYIYFPNSCKQAKRSEMIKFINWANCHMLIGAFQLLEDGTLRWRWNFDAENNVLTGVGLSGNVQHGWNIAHGYADTLLALALTKISADEAVADLLAEQKPGEHG